MLDTMSSLYIPGSCSPGSVRRDNPTSCFLFSSAPKRNLTLCLWVARRSSTKTLQNDLVHRTLHCRSRNNIVNLVRMACDKRRELLSKAEQIRENHGLLWLVRECYEGIEDAHISAAYAHHGRVSGCRPSTEVSGCRTLSKLL